MRAVWLAAMLVLALGCSNEDKKPSAGTGSIFGNAGSGGSGQGGAAGSGGLAGQAGLGGQGGSAGQAHGGMGGSFAGAAGQESDAGTAGSSQAGQGGSSGQDAGPLGPPDVIEVVDTCPLAQQFVSTKELVAAGETPQAFGDAYNAELQSLTGPGPFLLQFKGLDSEDSSNWQLSLGAPDQAGTGFDGTPATVSYHLGEQRALYVHEAEASFSLRFGSVDIPVVKVQLGGSFDESCESLFMEEMRLVIPDRAAGISFHGATLGELLGEPNTDYAPGKENAWTIAIWGQAQAVK